MLFELGRLRNMHEADLPQVLAWRNSQFVRQNMLTHHEITWDEHVAWFRAKSVAEDTQLLVYELDGVACGVVIFYGLSPEHRRGQWGFYAHEAAPKGVGGLMEFCALEHYFLDARFDKLGCEVLGFNTSVVRQHQKFGFEVEGILRRHYVRNGEVHDVHVLALMREVWTNVRDERLSWLLKLRKKIVVHA